MKKCVTYTRVSTEMQVDGFSLDAQMNAMETYAQNNGIEIVDRYQDAGKSGKDIMGRPDFRKMLSDIRNHVVDVDYVLVFKLSRFGRNTLDMLSSLKILQENQTELVSVKDNIDTSNNMGKLLLTVLAIISEMERENIAMQTMAGRREKARQGRWNGGMAPYGYCIGEGGVLCVVEEERAVVEKIFELYAEGGYGFGKIAKHLNTLGIRKDTHGYKNKIASWSSRAIQGIIDNEVYCGKMPYGRRTITRGKDGKDRIVFADEYISVDGLHEGIVPKELWERAQRRREKTKGKREKEVGIGCSNLLTGIVKCPECGSPMYMTRGSKRDTNMHFYYKCGRQLKVTGYECSYTKQLRQDEIDSQVYQAVVRMIGYEQFAKEVHEKLKQETDIDGIEAQINSTKKELKNTRANKRMLEKEMDGLEFDDPHYQKKRQDYQRRLEEMYDKETGHEEVLAELALKRNIIEANKLNEDLIYSSLENFVKLYEKFSFEEKRRFYKTLIEKVELYKEPLENGQRVKSISFKFPLAIKETGMAQCNGTGEWPQADNGTALRIQVDVPRLDIIPQRPATYKQINQYIKEKYGVSVHTGYIAQIKRKYGLDMRANYNISKKNTKRKYCTETKEKYIIEALKHFGMM